MRLIIPKVLYFCYQLIIFPLLVILMIPYFIYLVLKGRGREIQERLGLLQARDIRKMQGRKVIWIQAASVGEVRVAGQIIDQYAQREEDYFFLLTVMTPQGRSLGKKEISGVDIVSYLPLDFSPLLFFFLKKVQPDLLLLVETEIWPTVIGEAHRQQVPIAMVNGRISQQSFGKYRLFRFFFRPLLHKVAEFYMQSAGDKERIIEIGAPSERVYEAENIKLAEVLAQKEDETSFAVEGNRKIIVAGSTHSPEEEKMVEVFKNLQQKFPELLLVLAPRHIERREEVKFILKQKRISFQQRSIGISEVAKEAEVFLLDTLGELRDFYNLADIVFLGGTLSPVGGHNFLEAVAKKIPVVTGPQVDNIKSLLPEFQQVGAVKKAANLEEIESCLLELLREEEVASEAGRQGYDLLQKKSAAALKQLEQAEKLLPLKSSQGRLLFVRLSALGDVIQTLPALSWLAKERPNLEIHWLVEPLAAPLLEQQKYIDKVQVMPKNRWRGEERLPFWQIPPDIKGYFSRLAQEDYSVSLDFHGLLKSSLAAYLARAPVRFGPEGSGEGSSFFYHKALSFTARPLPATQLLPEHRISENLKLMSAALGKKLKPATLDYGLELPDNWQENLDYELKEFIAAEPQKPLYVIHPFTSWESKNWPLVKYRRLIGLLSGWPIKIIVSGTAQEREELQQIKPDTGHNVMIAAGRVTLPQLYGLLKETAIFIGGDTGPMHLAVAAGASIVAIMGPTDPETHGPYTEDKIVVQQEGIICLNCWKRKCPYDHHKCLQELPVQKVLEAVEELAVSNSNF